MRKRITFSLMAVLFSIGAVMASDFKVLTTPREVFEKSVENENGARAAFEAVLDNEAVTEAEVTAAMQAYVQKATPKAGYAFDMNFLLGYTHATDDNKGQYTQAKLAEAWSCDVDGVVFGQNNALMVSSSDKAGVYMRVDDKANLVSPIGQFIVYQTVELGEGYYHLQAGGFVAGLAKGATLSAGDLADSDPLLGGGVLKDYQVNFKMDATESIKLGFKRSDVAGKLTQVAFNNMELYKVSGVIEIKGDATEGLAPAENVDVQLTREFKAGQYYGICLPFIVENWRDVFEDLRLWTNYVDGKLQFKTVEGANTQARKPYLVKFKEDVSADDYIVFKGVKVEKGNAGSWVRASEENFPVKCQGNWAAGTVPANCYYLDGGEWKLSDGSVQLTAFSAYIDATGLENCPATMDMDLGTGTGIVNVSGVAEGCPFVDVYNLQGVMVKKRAETGKALEGLPAGLYIVNGKKLVKN